MNAPQLELVYAKTEAKNYTGLAAWLALALLLLSGWLAVVNMRRSETNDLLFEQTNLTQFAAERVLSTLKDAETGQRGYLLTADRSYLTPYNDALSSVDKTLRRLNASAMDEQARKRAARIEILAREKLIELNRTIDLMDAGDARAAIASVRSNDGKRIMDAIHEEVELLQEDAGLNRTRSVAYTSMARRWFAVFGLGAIALCIMGAVAWAHQRERNYVAENLARITLTESALRDSALTLQLALDASEQGIWSWEIATTDDITLDARAHKLYGILANASFNHAVWRSTIHPDDVSGLDEGLRRATDPECNDDNYVGAFRVPRPEGLLWLSVTGRALFREDASAISGRRAVRMIGTVRDISEAKREEEERHRTADLLRAILETAPGLIFAKDRAGRIIAANPSVLELVGKPRDQVEGRTDLEFLDDKEQARIVMANDQRVMESGRIETLEEAVGSANEASRIFFSKKAPLHDASGTVVGLVGVSVDITDRKAMEERLRVIAHEMNHRVKNTLATVQAIAAQTLRGADPMLRRTFEGRLMALAAAHDVLMKGSWQSADLEDVAKGALDPHGGSNASRFTILGQPLQLQPRAALALGMMLHELATNALKYGALQSESGKVDVLWSVQDSAEPMLHLIWREHGGPPVQPPLHRGFGTRLIERVLAQDLGGSISISFEDPAGVTCTLNASLQSIAA